MLTTLKFVRNISDYYIKNRNRYFIAGKKLPDNTIVYQPGKYFFSPDNLLIYKLWENHCTARYIRHEVADFVSLIKGKKSFLDIGASAGMFSAIFNAERSDSRILSVEPDNNSFALLEETRRLNGKPANTWEKAQVAMSDLDGEVLFGDGYFGGLIGGGTNNKQCRKLETLCAEHQFVPDVIKIDIESFEHEVITSSVEYLDKIRPRIQIEIHNDNLRERGIDPLKIYRALIDLGYRGIGAEGNLTERQAQKPIVHLHLVKE